MQYYDDSMQFYKPADIGQFRGFLHKQYRTKLSSIQPRASHRLIVGQKGSAGRTDRFHHVILMGSTYCADGAVKVVNAVCTF